MGSPAPIMEEVLKERKHEYGNLDPQELLQKLNQEGFHGAKLQHSPTSTSIHLVRFDDFFNINIENNLFDNYINVIDIIKNSLLKVI